MTIINTYRNRCIIPEYHYYSKDHLGNVRSVVTKNESTNAVTEVQKTHYYPFGGIIADLSTGRSEQNRLYNGKELDISNNLWWYDYGARQYDPTAPRFTTADPLAERNYNTDSYVYCGNNPVMRIDPDGRDWYEHTNDNNQKSAFWEDDNASSITIGEYTYENVGDTYTISYDWGIVNYNQQDIESIKFQGNSSSSMYEGFGKAAQAASLSSAAYTAADEIYMKGFSSTMKAGTLALGLSGVAASAAQISFSRNKNERNEAILDTTVSICSLLPEIGFYVGITYLLYKPIFEKGKNYTNQLNQYLENKFCSPESVGDIMQWGW